MVQQPVRAQNPESASGEYHLTERIKISRQRKLILAISVILLGLVIGGNTIEYLKRKEAELTKIRTEYQQLQEQKELLEKQKVELEEIKKQLETKLEAKAQVRVASARTPLTEAEAKAWIIRHEGGLTSVNKTSYACGKPQANPCDKLLDYAGVYHAKTVKPWNYTYAEAKALIAQVPASVQDAWMDRYVAGRYGTYLNAYRFWLVNRWY